MEADCVPQSAPAPYSGHAGLRGFTLGLFFLIGGITSLNDILIPKLRALFVLSYGEAMLVQSAFFGAYLIVSLPAAMLVGRIGYLRAACIGLLAMTAGCLLFAPASASGTYGLFLVALFVLASGVAFAQVVGNPLVTLLGPAHTASSRLTFTQAFNSLGTALFPYFASLLILGSDKRTGTAPHGAAALAAHRSAETQVIMLTYIVLGVLLLAMAVIVWRARDSLPVIRSERAGMPAFGLLKQPRFAFGALSIFFYVGAEVSIGSLIVAWLMQHDTLALAQQAAGKHVALYWGGALVGRFAGAALLRVIAPGKLLALAASAAILLLSLSAASTGPIAGWSLLVIGLCNAILFPTIFSLASEGLGARMADGSGFIGVAIVGGAILPPLTGHVADLTTLRGALAVPALCYAAIAAYGIYARRPLS